MMDSKEIIKKWLNTEEINKILQINYTAIKYFFIKRREWTPESNIIHVNYTSIENNKGRQKGRKEVILKRKKNVEILRTKNPLIWLKSNHP